MENLFEITELTCSYDGENNKVLEIKKLEIKKYQLIFLLGASGSGKSTLLETLGLMNRTIVRGELLFTPKASSRFEYHDLWKGNHQQNIGSIRKQYFSFIFQNTNLMENFTAYENVCLSRMIKESKPQDQVISGIKELMERVRLPEKEVNTSTLAMNLSGGQRQRLAFVRALGSHSSVLFCDEPTGNLDEANANELFEVIKENLDHGLTAIVVSHDIDLAVKHADQIVLITKETEKGYGEILPENIFDKSSWHGLTAEELVEFKSEIKKTFIPGVDHLKQLENNGNNSEGISSQGFHRLFFKRESTALAGKGFMNLIILSAIILFTFVAIGFANGSLSYLETKLNSAFVNWLTINIPMTLGTGILKDIEKDLDSEDLKTKFQYSTISVSKISNFQVRDSLYHRNSYVKIRTFDFNRDAELLHEFVLDKKRIVSGDINGFANENDMAVIVTSQLLRELGYPDDADYIWAAIPVSENVEGEKDSLIDIAKTVDKLISIPIRTVVTELPGKARIACTEYFWNAWLITINSPFDPALQTNNLYVFLRTDSSTALKVKTAIDTFFMMNKDDYDLFSPAVYNPQRHSTSFSQGFDVQINFFTPLPSENAVDSLFEKIKKLRSVEDLQQPAQHIYNYSKINARFTDLPYDFLSIYFTKLTKVREFSDYIFKKYNHKDQDDLIEVDMTKVVDKENFLFLSTITYIVAYLIIIFGSISVSLFIFNLLKMHLNKVKMNIGTFKAIGLGNNESRNIYFSIVFMFVISSLVIGFLLAMGVGFVINYFLTSEVKLEQGVVSYFKMFSWNTVIAVTIFIASSMIVSWITINRMLSKSPGDLIYNR